MSNEMPKHLKKWIVNQYFACENNTLTEDQRKKFLDLVEENQNDTNFIECFKVFNKLKKIIKNVKQ
jgi:hypothetical protein|tara:strand:- start:716 stop:913 length:198 start_codon:yes stop_codon:yes gene_type:complete